MIRKRDDDDLDWQLGRQRECRRGSDHSAQVFESLSQEKKKCLCFLLRSKAISMMGSKVDTVYHTRGAMSSKEMNQESAR